MTIEEAMTLIRDGGLRYEATIAERDKLTVEFS